MSSTLHAQTPDDLRGTRPWSRLPLAALGHAASKPRGQLILALLVLAVAAAPWPDPCQILPNILAAVGLAVVMDTGLLWLMERRWTFPTEAAIAALTIALVLSTTTAALRGRLHRRAGADRQVHPAHRARADPQPRGHRSAGERPSLR